MRSARDAAAYGAELRRIVRFLGISDGDMSQGSMRCDVNVSVRQVGAEAFGTKVEVKNMNSFSNMAKAIDFEIERQVCCSARPEAARAAAGSQLQLRSKCAAHIACTHNHGHAHTCCMCHHAFVVARVRLRWHCSLRDGGKKLFRRRGSGMKVGRPRPACAPRRDWQTTGALQRGAQGMA
jgi:GatB/GatE catalytic domain